MADFLLELLSEEIPARMQAKASGDLAKMLADALAERGLPSGVVEAYATPRRLAVIVRALPLETEATREERRGPRVDAQTQAIEGFLKSTGLTRDQLEEREDKKGAKVLFAVIDKPGRKTAAVLAEAIPAIIRAFPWPKSMRWGAASQSTESLRWVRPLQGIVAILGEDVVEFEVAGVKSGAATVGHRFHHPGIITIGSAHDYAEKLRACHVIIDPAERRRIIAEGAAKAAEAAGLTLVEDEGLIHENAGLTEWPVPLLGAFDPAFLEVPREVIQLTMRTNQKYFALTTGEGRLASNFVCVANIEASDGGRAIVAGNEKVLAARLSDAKFFWEHDLKVPLEEQAKKLDQIVFHERLGTVADKVERVAKLARWLVEEGIVRPSVIPAKAGTQEHGRDQDRAVFSTPELLDPGVRRDDEDVADLAAAAETAARLAKADLVTGMVGEFPELQGLIGGYLARAQGHGDAIADAIRDHYKPVGQGDEVPTAPVTVAVSLADKLDTLGAFFAIEERPSGSRDPFALRRAALGVISTLLANDIRMAIASGQSHTWLFAVSDSLSRVEQDFAQETLRQGFGAFEFFANLRIADRRQGSYAEDANESEKIAEERHAQRLRQYDEFRVQLIDFFADRLKVQQREAGVRHDLIDAVFALGGEDDLVRLLARVKALQAFVETSEGTDLLAGYKRAANILKKEGWGNGVILTEVGSQEHGGDRAGASLSNSEFLGPGVRRDDVGQNSLPYTPENEEAALIAALEAAEPRARAAVEAEDFEGAMAALASLRAPVDAFFDKVTVNDPDQDKRTARLNLLARMRAAVHQVADFSKIEG